MRNFQEQTSDFKNFANSRPSASNFKSFSRSLEHFFLTLGQNHFGTKILFFHNLKAFGLEEILVLKFFPPLDVKYIDPLPLLWFATVVVDTFDTTLVKLSKSWGRKVNYFTA